MVYEQFKQLDAVKHDRTIKSLIGVSRTHFDTLARAFAVAYDTVQLERLQQGEIKQVPSGGPKGSLDTFDKKLFFLLYDLKTYPVFDVLGFHFGLSGGHAHTLCDSAPAGSAACAVGPRRTARAVARNP